MSIFWFIPVLELNEFISPGSLKGLLSLGVWKSSPCPGIWLGLQKSKFDWFCRLEPSVSPAQSQTDTRSGQVISWGATLKMKTGSIQRGVESGASCPLTLYRDPSLLTRGRPINRNGRLIRADFKFS